MANSFSLSRVNLDYSIRAVQQEGILNPYCPTDVLIFGVQNMHHNTRNMIQSRDSIALDIAVRYPQASREQVNAH